MSRVGAADSGYRIMPRWPMPPTAAATPALKQTVAYCEYLQQPYGRFPLYPAAFRASVGYQAAHLEPDFHARCNASNGHAYGRI